MMDEKELEQQLNELGQRWRVPPEPPLDRMWARIEQEAFVAAPKPVWRWTRTFLPMAATLVLGIGIGQLAPPLLRGPSVPAPETLAVEPPVWDAPVQQASSTAPFVGVATDYLARVTALLVTLAAEPSTRPSIQYTTTQARDLLATTRLMMDAGEPIEPRLRLLLEDLELVLAQIVQLPARPSAPDVSLIDQAVDQREVLPRLRVMLAEHNPSQP
jgi:hypothetical protein